MIENVYELINRFDCYEKHMIVLRFNNGTNVVTKDELKNIWKVSL